MENKKTNRNTRLTIIAIVLALVVLFLCIGGSTFAKYITSKDLPTNQATVAKWGFVVNANADKLFGDAYNKGAVVTPRPSTADATVDVYANTAKKFVVAPGTNGEISFGVTGTAEVLAQVNITFTSSKDVSLAGGDLTDPYNPVKWTLNDGTTDVLTDKTLQDVVTYFSTAANKTIDVKPGENLNISYTLSWKWALTTDTTSDGYDTLLGYAAAGVDTYGDVTVADGGSVTVPNPNYNAGTEGSQPNLTYTAVTDIAFGLSISVEQRKHNA